jgi:hypothetical protein
MSPSVAAFFSETDRTGSKEPVLSVTNIFILTLWQEKVKYRDDKTEISEGCTGFYCIFPQKCELQKPDSFAIL